MKKFFLVLIPLCLLAGVINLGSNSQAGAQTQDAMNDPAANLGKGAPVYSAGLWNEGKAVFSDWALLDLFWGERYKRGYQPTQPILYSHKLHMEKSQMECQYCHSGVTNSNFATIPSVDLCMGCHKAVKTESPEIQKLKSYYDKGEPVPWVPVNNLPEHVRFTHKRHLKAGVSCQTCHGQVQKMAVVERVSSLKMGFCVSCHRENGASLDCSVCHY